MAEKEYIERELAKKTFRNGKHTVKWLIESGAKTIGVSFAILLDEVPAADVRHVVLCKDCMYAPSGTDGGEVRGFALEWPHDECPEDNPCPCKCEDGWYSRKPKPDFFCANGKREES